VATDESAGVTIARVVHPHGRRGEVAAEILTDFPQRLASLRSAALWDGRSEPRQVAVRSCWLRPPRPGHSHGGQAIFHFEGSDSISDAEKLTGLEVQIPLADRMSLPGGSYYVTDLIGCEVREKGERIGRVRDVQFTGEDVPGTPLLVLDSQKGEVLIPLAQEICTRIDTASRQIEVALLEGLLDLNASKH
jgi:16S rRNA processing protein RimM